jgi:hypothetical protein
LTVLSPLPPAQYQAWQLLFQLERRVSVSRALIGGQLVALLAAEHGAALPRTTQDADVLVDVRAAPGGIEAVCAFLTERGLELEGVSPAGVGHRFSRAADPGPGHVSVDVLAPDGLSQRTRIITVPPARTVSVPSGSALLAACESVEVTIRGMTGGQESGRVRRPRVLAALVGKAAATTISGRVDPERDMQDAALLLSLLDVTDPALAELSRSQRRHLRRLEPLLVFEHPAWRLLDREQSRIGRAALRLLWNRLGSV